MIVPVKAPKNRQKRAKPLSDVYLYTPEQMKYMNYLMIIAINYVLITDLPSHDRTLKEAGSFQHPLLQPLTLAGVRRKAAEPSAQYSLRYWLE